MEGQLEAIWGKIRGLLLDCGCSITNIESPVTLRDHDDDPALIGKIDVLFNCKDKSDSGKVFVIVKTDSLSVHIDDAALSRENHKCKQFQGNDAIVEAAAIEFIKNTLPKFC